MQRQWACSLPLPPLYSRPILSLRSPCILSYPGCSGLRSFSSSHALLLLNSSDGPAGIVPRLAPKSSIIPRSSPPPLHPPAQPRSQGHTGPSPTATATTTASAGLGSFGRESTNGFPIPRSQPRRDPQSHRGPSDRPLRRDNRWGENANSNPRDQHNTDRQRNGRDNQKERLDWANKNTSLYTPQYSRQKGIHANTDRKSELERKPRYDQGTSGKQDMRSGQNWGKRQPHYPSLDTRQNRGDSLRSGTFDNNTIPPQLGLNSTGFKVPPRRSSPRAIELGDNGFGEFEFFPEERTAHNSTIGKNNTSSPSGLPLLEDEELATFSPAFSTEHPVKPDKQGQFYDIDSLLTSISSEVDTPKVGVLPSVKAREKREKTRLAKLGLEPGPDGILRPHHRKKHSHGDEKERAAEVADRRKWRAEKERKQAIEAAKRKAEPIPILLPDFITVANLARALEVPFNRFVRTMEELGFDDCRHDHILNAETAGLVAMELGFAPQNVLEEQDDGDLYPCPPAAQEDLRDRPPVVTIMGHVDHGKTTLLDHLRSTSVAAGEHGGITQHIGAFSVPLSSGQAITFLDTPGHAAFLAMRQRGASVTDIVVLVVAADDGVMPQTKEAIRHAREAGVPLIVAINKMDREDAEPDRVKSDLAMAGVEVEDWGGDTQAVLVSGKSGLGMPELEDSIITLAEMLELKSDPAGSVEGWVVEAQKRLSGMAATMIVRRGTLRVGDVIVAGTSWARVRTLRNEAGELLTEAGPGCPVEVEGWRQQPEAGDEVLQARDEQHASDVTDIRHSKEAKDKLGLELSAMNEARTKKAQARDEAAEAPDRARSGGSGTSGTATNGDGGKEGKDKPPPSIQYALHSSRDETGRRLLPFLIKADVDGSADAVSTLISDIGNKEVAVKILKTDIGTITKSDIEFAATTGAHIISFNVPVPPSIVRDASMAGINIISESVIYRVDERVRDVLSDLLDPIITHNVTGEAEVLKPFEIDAKASGGSGKKTVVVAGCKVKNGIITRNSKIRVMRGGVGGEIVFDGKLSSLRQVKKDVMEIRKDAECGMIFDNWGAVLEGDWIQCYSEKSEKRRL